MPSTTHNEAMKENVRSRLPNIVAEVTPVWAIKSTFQQVIPRGDLVLQNTPHKNSGSRRHFKLPEEFPPL